MPGAAVAAASVLLMRGIFPRPLATLITLACYNRVTMALILSHAAERELSFSHGDHYNVNRHDYRSEQIDLVLNGIDFI